MGLIQTLKKNDSVSFDLIKNQKGEEHYKDDFVLIDIDNIEEETKTGFYDGVSIEIYNGDDIKNFEKVAADKSAWEYKLPITKLQMQSVTSKQVEKIIQTIGPNLLDLSINFSDFKKLNTDLIVTNCPKLKALTLKASSWDEDDPIKLTLQGIDKLKLDFLKLEISGSDNAFDLSKCNINTLEWYDFDASKSKLPSKLKSLNAFVLSNKIDWSYLSELETLELGFSGESTISDLTFIGSLTKLKKLLLNLGGETSKFSIKIPSALENFELNTSGLECDLSILKSAPNLKSLNLTTDVYNRGKGFKNIASISELTKLEMLEIDENANGVDKFKSEFSTSLLKPLHNLKSLDLRGIISFKDLSEISSLKNIETLQIRNSKIQSLKGIEQLTNLKSLKLFDCHSISDLTYLTNKNLEKFNYYISSAWGTEVKLKPEDIQKLDQVSIKEIEIEIENKKITKKDLAPLSKKYNIEIEGTCVWLTLK
jgi:hypothetical protein